MKILSAANEMACMESMHMPKTLNIEHAHAEYTLLQGIIVIIINYANRA